MDFKKLIPALVVCGALTSPLAWSQNSACKMMTVDEVNKFANGKVKTTEAKTIGSVQMCDYKAEFSVVSLHLFPHTLTGVQQMEVARKQYSDGKPVPGVGDEAFLSRSLQTLVFRKKNTVVQVQGLFLEQWQTKLPEIAKFLQDRVPE